MWSCQTNVPVAVFVGVLIRASLTRLSPTIMIKLLLRNYELLNKNLARAHLQPVLRPCPRPRPRGRALGAADRARAHPRRQAVHRPARGVAGHRDERPRDAPARAPGPRGRAEAAAHAARGHDRLHAHRLRGAARARDAWPRPLGRGDDGAAGAGAGAALGLAGGRDAGVLPAGGRGRDARAQPRRRAVPDRDRGRPHRHRPRARSRRGPAHDGRRRGAARLPARRGARAEGRRRPEAPAAAPGALRVQPVIVSASRTMFSATITAATAHATTDVSRRLTSSPISDLSRVKMTSGISANGIPNESTTWLRTSAADALTPIAMMTSAGAMVIVRRRKSGIRRWMKP